MFNDFPAIIKLYKKCNRGESLTEKEVALLEKWRSKGKEEGGYRSHAVIWKIVGVATFCVFFMAGGRGLKRDGPIFGQIAPNHFREFRTRPDGSRQIWDSIGAGISGEVQLPDGSEAQLAYCSSLLYPECRTPDMEVYLIGQAYFTIARHENSPFTVASSQSIIRVLGTRFNVLDYPNEPAEITLLNGKILVEHKSAGQQFMLSPSEQAVIEDKVIKVRPIGNLQDILGWMNPEPFIYFENTALITVVRRLACWYQVKVVNPQHIGGGKFTGILSLSNPLDENLANLNMDEHSKVNLERKEDTIYVKPRNF